MKVLLADLSHSYSPSAMQSNYPSEDGDGFVVPLGIASIGAYAKKVFGDDIDIALFKFPDDLLNACDDCDIIPPDVVGFSNYVWNTHLNFTIGTELRKRFPNALFVAGGPSVQTDGNGVEEYLLKNKFIDVCVIHEGERTFSEILATYQESGKIFIEESRPISGAGYLSPDGRCVYTENTNSGGLDELPSPYLEGYLDSFLSRGFVPMFETNRGCPFACTFCAWGIAALDKVRKFSVDRIYSELDYIVEKAPNTRTWFIADANFGMLKRDVDIARRINEIKNKNPALKTIVQFEGKNTPDRNYIIAQLLRDQGDDKGPRLDNALIALQTLDESAQIATKRDNIKLSNVSEKVASYHADGYGVRTDILSGLPGETLDGHLNTLRKVFDFDFDQLGIYNVVLLGGTEMASRDSRDTYSLLTKFFTRDGYFGEYNGIRSVEAEEVVCGNSTISPDDLMSTRLLHWAIWFGWNHKFLKPMLRYAKGVLGKNPVDVLYSLVKGKAMETFFNDLRNEYANEFFESAESLQEHYLHDSIWASLKGKKQKPTHIMHNAKLIYDRDLFSCMLEGLRDIVMADADPTDFDEICRLLIQMRVDPDDIYAGDFEAMIPVSIPSHLVGYFFGKTIELKGECHDFILQKPIKEQESIRKKLKKYGYSEDPLYAVASTAGHFRSPFAYDLVFQESMPLREGEVILTAT